jgi:hypothetical protein
VSVTITVDMAWPDGLRYRDAIREPDVEVAMERARSNWPGAEVTFVGLGDLLEAGP